MISSRRTFFCQSPEPFPWTTGTHEMQEEVSVSSAVPLHDIKETGTIAHPADSREVMSSCRGS